MLLFERLIDFAPQEADEVAHVALHQEANEIASIRREIGRLIQTRRAIGVVRALDALPTSVREYGIPDASTLSPRSDEDRAAFAQTIRDAIISYEPRLQQPMVEVYQVDNQTSALRVVVTGGLRGQANGRRMSFPFQPGQG
jgi:type VI secretion system protein ImpF